MKAFTLWMISLILLASITFAQPPRMSPTDTAHDREAHATATDQPVLVAQAPAQAPAQAGACINPKTGQPDRLVQCLVAPCRAFKPSSPFATCVDNYCGGCHALLCGILLEDVAGGVKPAETK